MKFLVQLVTIVVIAFILQSFLPWWTMTVGAFFIGYLFKSSGWSSFLSGFLGVGLLWVIMAWIIDSQTASILSEKIAQLFPGKSVILLFLFTGIVGGLSGGLASLTGSLLQPKK